MIEVVLMGETTGFTRLTNAVLLFRITEDQPQFGHP
jgi:hypothetical protein